jgi:hypothetical protein
LEARAAGGSACLTRPGGPKYPSATPRHPVFKVHQDDAESQTMPGHLACVGGARKLNAFGGEK